MVGSAVATMVWSSAARNIARNRLHRTPRTFLGAGPVGQEGGQLPVGILGGGGADLALGALSPPGHGDARFRHRSGIARNQGMPPIEIAALGDEPVTAARRQPVQGADVFRR